MNRITMKWEPVNLGANLWIAILLFWRAHAHLEVLMVISIDTLLIKQLRKTIECHSCN